VETTEYQSRIEGLNGTALVLPLSAPRVMNRANAMYGLAVVNLKLQIMLDYFGLLTILWNVSRSQKAREYYAHSLSLMTVLLPVVGLKIR
jgi:hypothetical protein